MGYRTVADVAFNADPSTGQYVAVMAPGSTQANWISVGGTSLATPQWAGLLALVNASRALVAKPVPGAPHAVLYGQIATVPGNYASAFADITTGTDGPCATCTATVGYDNLSGLGTPNVAGLLGVLTAGAPAPAAPAPAKDSNAGGNGQSAGAAAAAKPGLVITAPAMTGVLGKALSATISIADTSAGAWVSVSFSGAPAGMSFSSRGKTIVANWRTPVVGSFNLSVTATDSTGLTAQTTVPINVTAN